ncbi:PREDICTED: pentatricopeptide repeat-containing protein At3g60960, mitochondrial [Camelina sativa]|uniref:Pentatricopeptide repeat-containing protein At3g60960, mitochondrial n=1 Tax=Camelina sativa TaxID=90675 RepID=A0ABM0WNU0_CAMSA|nr:PREDICTED: pentatricopeptide repeat-containing protein At3g60960, mitochondrial [Camelina sativa]
MSLLRRIVRNSTVSKVFKPYPLGTDPSSLRKLDPVSIRDIDNRPISLRYRVTVMIEMSNIDKASKLARLAVMDELRVDRDTVFICNSIIGAMCSARRYDEAISLFNYFFNECQTLPNMLSCNLVMKAHCDQGRVDDALELYRHVLQDGSLAPGIETYRILTRALVDSKRFDEACDLVRSIRSFCSFMVYDILIRGFLDIGNLVKASQIMEEWKESNNNSNKVPRREYDKAVAVFNVSFVKYFFKQGKDEKAMEILATLEDAQVLEPVVGNRVLQVLVEHGKNTEAWELFGEMIEICDSETVDIMSRYFSDKKTVPLVRLRKTCYRAMIACLCDHGKVSEAEKLFAEMFTDVDGQDLLVGPDLSTFRAMINGYVQVGRVDGAIKTLNKLRISNIRKLAIHRDP